MRALNVAGIALLIVFTVLILTLMSACGPQGGDGSEEGPSQGGGEAPPVAIIEPTPIPEEPTPTPVPVEPSPTPVLEEPTPTPVVCVPTLLTRTKSHAIAAKVCPSKVQLVIQQGYDADCSGVLEDSEVLTTELSCQSSDG